MSLSPYEMHNNQVGVRLSFILTDEDRKNDRSVELTSYGAYKKRAKRTPGFRLKQGRGAGNEALVCWDMLPYEWQEAIKNEFGEFDKEYNPLEKFWEVSAEAKRFYDEYQDEDGEYLNKDQKERYTANASIIEAIIKLKADRKAQRKSRSGSLKGIWASLKKDAINFNEWLKEHGYRQHTLPSSERYFKNRVIEFQKFSYHSLIDGRRKNTNRQVVTAEMLTLWKAIYAGQKNYKPTYIEVARKYEGFLNGHIEVLNEDTGELFNPTDSCYKPASDSTIFSYQKIWENRVATHSKRSGNRQVFKSIFEPYHKMDMPKFAGSIISIDDRQPPFKNENGDRLWFYLGIDLGSSAFTTWVYGSSKEGIILDFYRQMVRNYTAWGKNIPHELECEMSLNSSYQETLLQNGAMFQKVRIEANNARGKRIERYFKDVRYGREKKLEGWLPRPHANSESNQGDATKVPRKPSKWIIENVLKIMEDWNNEPHPDQESNPGMTRWDHFWEKQHPELKPTNWNGILPHIGYRTETSMKAGRILLQNKARVVGFEGKVATGEKLINIMRRIEGKDVVVYWLDDHQGNVLKSLVYDREENLICELLGDLAYNRASLEQTPEDLKNRELISAYTNTVQTFIRDNAREIEPVVLIEKPKPFTGKRKFQITEIGREQPQSDDTDEVVIMEDNIAEEEELINTTFTTSTKDRF